MADTVWARFVGGEHGIWQTRSIRAVCGEPLTHVARVAHEETAGRPTTAAAGAWSLAGCRSHGRYATRDEKAALVRVEAGLGRSEATRAALIPITKSEAWWSLAQDERRAVFEERSRHGAIGLAFLPAIARRLYHGRDHGEVFDFLTWFEYAPEHESAFDDLVAALRETEEWRYVVREVDIRLERAPA